MIENISSLFLIALAGSVGGLINFYKGLWSRHYQNGGYVRKASIEILGGSLVATLIVPFFTLNNLTVAFPIAVSVGMLWGYLIQKIRNRITKIVEVALRDLVDEHRDK